MGLEAQSRPDIVVPLTGVLMLGLAAARLTTGPGPGGPWFAIAVGAAGMGLSLWGFARLRRARAARSDVSWCRLLRAELVAFGVVAIWLPVWASLPEEYRDALLQFAQEAFELVTIARGWHA